MAQSIDCCAERARPPGAKYSRLIALMLSAGALGSAHAFTFDTGNDDIKASWANTFKYSAGWRLGSIDPAVAGDPTTAQVNVNDGDNNFRRGAMISNRIDLLSELDLRYKDQFGFHLSGAGWYDAVYNHGNDNTATSGVNSVSVPYNQFTEATRQQAQTGEFRDAFGFANLHTGGVTTNIKLGQFTQLYGESLFFGYNGIAGAQTPLDLARALAVPNSQFKEIAMPVEQIAGTTEINPNLTVGAYYQFQWRKDRLPAAGSYFSFADFADAGGERLLLGPSPGGILALHRGTDIDPRKGGQGGVEVKFNSGNAEWGLYAAQFHDKLPQFYARPGVNAQGPYGAYLDAGDYVLVYGENIRTVGASVSTVLGETNVAAELSMRTNQPLVAKGITVVTGAASNGGSNPAYPVGNTLHLNISAISVYGASPLWQGASFVGELAYNHLLQVTRNPDQLDPLATRDATALQFVFQPEYFQVLPGLDLQVPIGVAYGIAGRSSVAGVAALMPPEHGGNITVGLKGNYQNTWQTSLNLTHYFGPSGAVIQPLGAPSLSYKNFLGDRDFVSLSIQRTF